MPLSHDALELLDLIEALEMRSLVWGFTSGSLTETEALDLISNASNAEDALEELNEARLVIEIKNSGGSPRYRSRFAEAVRLISANRQLFPNKPWQGAPALVADFRVDRRRRRFPRRDRIPEEILASHEKDLAPTSFRRTLWRALTGSPDMRLSAFQERASLRLSLRPEDSGTIITAGTGSGKTNAFYIPAMLAVGEAIGPETWVKVLAIYPRVELLKDQFAEAFRMARATDEALSASGKRPISIGALFRATPRYGSARELQDRGWTKRGQDWVCPWMRCPKENCESEMHWLGIDLANGRERLKCSRPGCGTEANDCHVVLTRQRIQQQPPDLLFTTTEILNQRLSDHWMRSVFGIGSGRKPFLALLDEVHTYAGTGGAQAALTLRRWRHLLGAPLHWVGLSATLGDAPRFFADLTGTPLDSVVEINPLADEFEETGAEYQLMLRGDPSSRASLLSTTIQTAMLLSRVLDPPQSNRASGAFGRRAFLFTDDLDVTNRLFDDLRDAEAYTIFGKPDNARQPLAALRATGPDARARELEGQRWRICEEIGHNLNDRLVIGRTTSQDAGVIPNANIVVATSSLEVGFNDPQVGAVIQHKAPRGMASFLQRKGRAGRSRAMRPITVTVLSDYGRDRALYQSYERLFDPQLEPQYLPVGNPYVLKMQATFSFFDWLSAETAGSEKAWAWDILSRPVEGPSAPVSAVLERVKSKLKKLVRGDQTEVDSLLNHLIGALCIDEQTAQGLLWSPPRALLLEAAPTLVRRLFRRWRLAFSSGASEFDLNKPYHPLPDFVPRNLFSDLSLPEVRVLIPPATTTLAPRTESMPVLQALRQLVPGRVTRRFAFERGGLSHWVPVDPTQPIQHRRIREYAQEYEFVGKFIGNYNDPGNEGPLLVFRPWTVQLEKVARTEALPSSNAQLVWRTDIVPQGQPVSLPVSPRSPWRTFVPSIDFYLHRFRANAAVRRVAPTAHATVRTIQDEMMVALHFCSDDSRPAAVGFEIEVDGFHLDVFLPSGRDSGVNVLSQKTLRETKLSYLRERFRDDTRLPPDFNSFQRDWLFQMLVAAMAEAVAAGVDVENLEGDILSEAGIDEAFRNVMAAYFGDVPLTVTDNDDELSDEEESEEEDHQNDLNGRHHHQSTSRLQKALTSQLSRPVVRESLRAIVQEMLTTTTENFDRWLRRLVLETLGEAMLQAAITSAPRQATLDNLLVDIREDSEARPASIWITETTLGGAGVLQSFAERFSAEPNAFFDAVEAALAPTDLELVDSSLRRILELARSDEDVKNGMARLRATESHTESAEIWRELSLCLNKLGGIDLSHAVVVALNSRLLRPSAGPELDTLIGDLVAHWDAVEQRMGMAIGLREFAYAASSQKAWRDRVHAYLTSNVPSPTTDGPVFSVLFSLLWPRENEVRQTSLSAYNPYRAVRATDPAVVRELLFRRTIRTIDIGAPGWKEATYVAFAEDGACRLQAKKDFAKEMRASLVIMAATPADVGVLQFFPVVERIQRNGDFLMVDLVLREHAS